MGLCEYDIHALSEWTFPSLAVNDILTFRLASELLRLESRQQTLESAVDRLCCIKGAVKSLGLEFCQTLRDSMPIDDLAMQSVLQPHSQVK